MSSWLFHRQNPSSRDHPSSTAQPKQPSSTPHIHTPDIVPDLPTSTQPKQPSSTPYSGKFLPHRYGSNNTTPQRKQPSSTPHSGIFLPHRYGIVPDLDTVRSRQPSSSPQPNVTPYPYQATSTSYSHQAFSTTCQNQPSSKHPSSTCHDAKCKFDMKNLTLITRTDRNQSRQPIQLIDEISSQWKKVGDLLGLSTGQINAIEKNGHYQVQECCREIMAEWLNNSTKYNYKGNWEGFLQLLEDLNLSTIAQDLRDIIY